MSSGYILERLRERWFEWDNHVSVAEIKHRRSNRGGRLQELTKALQPELGSAVSREPGCPSSVTTAPARTF